MYSYDCYLQGLSRGLVLLTGCAVSLFVQIIIILKIISAKTPPTHVLYHRREREIKEFSQGKNTCLLFNISVLILVRETQTRALGCFKCVLNGENPKRSFWVISWFKPLPLCRRAVLFKNKI